MEPKVEYEQRRSQRLAEVDRLTRLAERLSRARILVFAAGLLLVYLTFDRRLLPPAILALPVALFVGLIVAHHRVRRARRRAERAARFYAAGLERLSHTWAGKGRTGAGFLDPSHPYAADLDLFGRGSLFELLCTARTQAGEETLARWLLVPAAPDDVRGRQQAIDELRSRLDLREEMAFLGEDIRGAVDPAALTAWAAGHPWQVTATLRVLAAALPLLTLAAAAAWYGGIIGPWPMLGGGAAQLTLAAGLRRRVLAAMGRARHPAEHLALLAEILGRIEREAFRAPTLVGLRAALDSAGEPPSRRIARLQRLIDLLDAHRNQMFALVSLALLWRTNCTLAIEAWRAVSGPAVPRWLAAVGELEALLALASHAYEHPADPFPALAEGGPIFDGDGLGHPLLPEERCVRNDVRLGDELRVLIVSGSNMSGKSTLLRTIGVNVVLALAGAPVRARRLRLSPLAIGASIRIVDSLQDGTSRFYAEVQRLSRIVDIARGPVPLLFLLDEILGGTNSHDRAIGAEAVVRTLAESGAIGLVTTHDLALARIADGLASHAGNVHFEDHLEDGRMCFDYRMRPGVVTKSNALALMRAVGLEV
jgi:MutS domain V